MHRHLLCILAILSLFVPLQAQIEFNGTIDLEVSSGGKDSKFLGNEVAAEYKDPHLSISQINLFGFSQVTDNFSVNTRIQFDTWGSGTLNPPKITLAVLSWEPQTSSFSLSAGRYISPFGLYPRRILSAPTFLVFYIFMSFLLLLPSFLPPCFHFLFFFFHFSSLPS